MGTTPHFLRLRYAFCLAGLVAGAQLNAFGATSVSFEAAGNHRTKMARLGVQFEWTSRWWKSNGTYVGGYWDATLSHWRGNRYRNEPGRIQNITSLGITPVVRFQNESGKGVYAEGAIGLHYLSELYDNDGRRLSTRLQFGDHLAIGYIFENNWDLGLKLQHFSNGSVKKPNDGVNFVILRLAYLF
jgi:lipid A 3-O-deacylase